MTPDTTITRSVPLLDYEIERSGDGRTVVAYAAAFNNLYEVRDHQGHYDEKINPVAFNKVLARSNAVASVQVHFNHGLTLWGTPSDRYSVPVGVPLEIRPDGRGLLTRTRYANTELGDEILQLWVDGAIRGQSFRGPTYPNGQRTTQNGPNGRPVIERMQLGLTEYGPTPNPANDAAGLVAIRSQLLEQFGQLTDDERAALAELLAETPTLGDPAQTGPDAGPATDPVAPAAPPAADLLGELLELANANRRRRTL